MKNNKLDVVKEVESLRAEMKKAKNDVFEYEIRIADLERRYRQQSKEYNKAQRKLQEYELLLAVKVGI